MATESRGDPNDLRGEDALDSSEARLPDQAHPLNRFERRRLNDELTELRVQIGQLEHALADARDEIRALDRDKETLSVLSKALEWR
jgi:predicted  nucleic acid-binding Zn-ribbon protein